jgi:hypothetical protein
VRGTPTIGKTRICVAGFTLSHHTGRARDLADEIVKAFPERFESWFYFAKPGKFFLLSFFFLSQSIIFFFFSLFSHTYLPLFFPFSFSFS